MEIQSESIMEQDILDISKVDSMIFAPHRIPAVRTQK
jgi:hypothetical protein